MADIYGLSERAANQLRDLLTQREGGNYPTGRAGSERVKLVECISATAAGATGVLTECYPARFVEPSSDTALPAEDGYLCLLTLINSTGASATPTAGATYLCLVTGDTYGDGNGYTAPRSRCFGIAPAAGGGGGTIPSTPTDSIPTLDGAGNLQATPTFATDTPLNGDPATQQFQYTDPAEVTAATDPHHFQQSAQDIDGSGNPGVMQAVYTAGTGGATTWSQTISPVQYQQQYTPTGGQVYAQVISATQFQQGYTPTGATSAYQTVTASGGQVQFQQGNSAGTQGTLDKPTISSGNVTQYQQSYALWDSGGAAIRTATHTYTATATGINHAAGSTYTGDYGSAAGFKLPNTTTTIGGFAVTLAGALVTSGAYTLTLTLVSNTALTLPASGTLLSTGNGGMQWVKWGTVTYTDLTPFGPGLNAEVSLTSLAARAVVLAGFVHTRVAGVATGITQLAIGMETSGQSTLLTGTTNGLALNDTGGGIETEAWGWLNWSATTAVILDFASDVDLSTMTAGEWDLWLFMAVLP